MLLLHHFLPLLLLVFFFWSVRHVSSPELHLLLHRPPQRPVVSLNTMAAFVFPCRLKQSHCFKAYYYFFFFYSCTSGLRAPLRGQGGHVTIDFPARILLVSQRSRGPQNVPSARREQASRPSVGGTRDYARGRSILAREQSSFRTRVLERGSRLVFSKSSGHPQSFTCRISLFSFFFCNLRCKFF